jgi:hypothetical protein
MCKAIYANPRRARPCAVVARSWRGKRHPAAGRLVPREHSSIVFRILGNRSKVLRLTRFPASRSFYCRRQQREKRNAMRGQANRSRFDRQTLNYGRDPSASAFNTLPFNRTVLLLRSGAVTVKRAPGEGHGHGSSA